MATASLASRHLIPARLVRVILICTGVVALAVGLITDAQRAWANVLAMSFLTIGIGLAAPLLRSIFCVTGATWVMPLRQPLRNSARLLPFGAVGLLVVLLLCPTLYPWTQGEQEGHQASAFQHFWLQQTFFYARAVGYLACWFLMGYLLKRAPRNQALSALFLVLFALTWWLASVDWIMSIEPAWSSTMFGLYSFSGLLLGGLAITTLLTVVGNTGEARLQPVSPRQLHDLGKLLFAFSTFWMYIWYCQYMLIWFVNIPEEASYYVRRLQGAWQPLLIVSIILSWVVPFFALMPRANKSNESLLIKVSLAILLGRCLDAYLMVIPAVEGLGDGPVALDLAFWAGGAGCVWWVLAAATNMQTPAQVDGAF